MTQPQGIDAWIALGANLGDRPGTLAAARAALAGVPHCQARAHSSLWLSPPMDADGPDYLNAVVVVRTSLTPTALLEVLQTLEQHHGRERPYAGAPRTLDLDLLLHGATRLVSPTLHLPHPRMTQRAFVLRPMAEINPALEIPGHGPIEPLLAHVAAQTCTRWPHADWPLLP